MYSTVPDEFFRVRLVDYALPPICDGDIEYYDTAEHIRLLYERSLNGRNREEARRCLAAMEEYLSGRGPGNIQLQLEGQQPLLSRVKLLGKRIWECGPQTYRFCNAWNCGTDVAMDGARVEAVYLEDPASPPARLIRCVKLQVKRPRTPNFPADGWMNYWETKPWGYPHMIEKCGPDILENSLYYPDCSFQTAEELQQDMKRPRPVDFKRFFLEIHGDG